MVEVKHRIWIQAPPRAVRAQFADLRHHIEANVHAKLKFEVLAQDARHARFTQEVNLMGLRLRNLFERTVAEDGSIQDVSIDGFNKGATMDFRFRPSTQRGRAGTQVDIRIGIPLPLSMSWAAPVVQSQLKREVAAAALEDKYDLEQRGYRPHEQAPA
jgi:hypothetical protein